MKKSIRFIQFPVRFIDTSIIYAVTSKILAEKSFKVKGMIYEEINMTYTVSSMIYAVNSTILEEKISTFNGMIYKEINMIYTIPSVILDPNMIYSQQHDLYRLQYDLYRKTYADIRTWTTQTRVWFIHTSAWRLPSPVWFMQKTWMTVISMICSTRTIAWGGWASPISSQINCTSITYLVPGCWQALSPTRKETS